MNLTDNEIIKALECCTDTKSIDKSCKEKGCPYRKRCIGDIDALEKAALDLINRKTAENKDLFYKLTGVMHSVDKWLEGDELKGDEVQRACTMREKTLRITEQQKAEIERLHIEGLQINKTFMDFVNKQKSEAIKEFQHKSESILIKLYEEYHRIANKPNNAWFKRFTKEENEMFYQGRAEAIWECISVNRDIVKEMVGENNV